MTYSCIDGFVDLTNALGAEDNEDPAVTATQAMAEIKRLKERDATLALLEDSNRTRYDTVRLALRLIRTARNHLRNANANKAADYVARAMKSVEGAERHARRMERSKQVCTGRLHRIAK